MEDYYKILEVTPKASSTDIKAAYRSLCQEYHPDKLPIGTPEKARKHIEERFKQVNEAYSVISNPEMRQAYDLKCSQGVFSSDNQDSTTCQSSVIFEPEKLRQVAERLEALKKNIELEYKETQVEADRFVKQQIKGMGYKEEDLEGNTVIGKIGISIFTLCLFFIGIGWMASGTMLLGIAWAGFWLLSFLKVISSPTLSIKTAQKIQLIKKKASEKKLKAQQKQQKELDEMKQYQQGRVNFFKSIPIFMLSEDYIANLTDEDQLYLLQSLNERNDAADLGQNVQAVAQVAIGVGLLAVLFGVG
ncbi:DnaJ domain-containing protein [Chamaesiphon sp. OTE_20_metabat_361]|uniref:DnaJ domain-containing protein n=1 Tax=Chamaesiphon sp. OTE_20_metabat_361 TaxID=2964689 RepID=UPI00286B3683|nr:DnaJ domain-containing protein [Chamaesiphon sp. OTE_20_metabat_361]